ncbi:MAG TPA: carbohydrate kinase family protein [Acidimicrobiales bacterium]|nr:carbohydrate kinase family protein [Acidimicrobiales bacterium]
MDWAERWVRATDTPRLLVVGGASLDRIHVRGEPVATPGGAGLYTALAAARAGVEVTMLAPLPDPMPPELAPALDRIRWVGPTVDLDGLPRFEIAYDDDGAVTLFREHLGAEPAMAPELLDLVPDLPACAYCVPFMDAGLQRRFVDALRDRGCLTVAATYGKAARLETALARATLDLADLSFCNADEAGLLYGDDAAPAVGHLRFVTRGKAGVTVFQGDHRTEVTGQRADALDPTGAGDTFCGTTLARLLAGDHPVEAARRGNAAAAEMVTAVGPEVLWRPDPPPHPIADPRVRVDHDIVDRLAAIVGGLSDLQPFPFTGDLFPAVGDPGTIDWFAAATLQQFGFWHERDGGWAGSMIATIDGAERKGSDYLWAAYQRWARTQPDAMSPERQAALTLDGWHALAAADDGIDPFPDPALWVELANAHGRSLLALGTTATELVAAASAAGRPMRALLTLLDHVGGYREDPLRKKAALLGVILRQRPDGLLPPAAEVPDDAPPIVDYHVQRTALRTGMVAIDDADLRARVAARRLLDEPDERAVRRATFDAVAALSARSGRDMGTVDWFLFTMRHRCPEASAPQCATCPADPACAHRIELFQPVRRTTDY